MTQSVESILVSILEGNEPTEEKEAIFRSLSRPMGTHDEPNMMPIHYAVVNRHNQVLRHLIATGCDINIQTARGRSAAMIAALMGSKATLQILLDAGADASLRDEKLLTLLHYVVEKGWLDVVRHIVESGLADINAQTIRLATTPLLTAADLGHRHIVKYLLQAGADVSLWDKEKDTLLHVVVRKNYINLVRMIVQRPECNINEQNLRGNTALHLACMRKSAIIIGMLAEVGADVNIKNSKGQTPLSCIKWDSPNFAIYEILFSHNAYCEANDYSILCQNIQGLEILANVDLCSNAIIGKYNEATLPALYSLVGSLGLLPPMERLKIRRPKSVINNLKQSVYNEIRRKKICKLVDFRHPMVLQMLAVKALLKHHETSLKRRLDLNSSSAGPSSKRRCSEYRWTSWYCDIP